MTSVSMFVNIYDLFLHSQQRKMAQFKSPESQFRFVCPFFGSVNSKSALNLLMQTFRVGVSWGKIPY